MGYRRMSSKKRCLLLGMILFCISISVCACDRDKTVKFNGDTSSRTESGQDVYSQDDGSLVYQYADGTLGTDVEKALQDAGEQEETIVWIMPFVGEPVIEKSTLASFNQQLEDRGESLQLEICYIYDDAEDSYDRQLKILLEKGYGDICNTGYLYTTENLKNLSEMKEKKYFRNLADILDSESGKMLKNAYSDYEWKSVEENGRIYTIPNQCFMPHRGYLAFSRKYFSEKIAETYDGNIEKLDQYLTDAMKKELGEDALIWGLSYYDTLNLLGIYDLYGVWGKESTGQFQSACSDERYTAVLKMLHHCREEGILNSISDLENILPEDMEKEMRDGEFGIAVVPDNMDWETVKKNAYIVELPYHYIGDYAQGNAIIQSSSKWEKVLRLYGLLVSSSEDANCLVLGKENEDYILKDGYACDVETQESLSARFAKQNLGIADCVYNGRGEYFGKQVKKGKKQYFSTELFTESCFNGFKPDFTKLEPVFNSLDYEESFNIWKEADFEEQYRKLQDEFAAQQKKVTEQLNRQVGDWRNGKQ